MLEGLIPSVGTVGDALGNGLCETTIGRHSHRCPAGHHCGIDPH